MITHSSGICRHTAISELTFYQITLFTDCLQTLISYVHALMNIQTSLLPECLITYFTGIMTLNITHALMSYKT